jgi:hypothetical protein
MKNLFAFLLIIIGSSLYGQTDSIEKATIYAKFLSKDLLQEELSDIGVKWNETIKKINKYPDLPLDQNGDVHYLFLNNFKSISKEKLFHRVLEYLSMNFGLYPVNLYSNLEDGKIIFGNSFTIDAIYTGNFTGIITIKDEKILIEYINIGYQLFYSGHYSGDSWVPDRTSNFKINHYFPVILKDSKEWNFNLKLFKTTNEYFLNEVDKLYDYSMNYDSNYLF